MATSRTPREQRLMLQRFTLAEAGLLADEPFLVLTDHEGRLVTKITLDADTATAILWHNHSYIVEFQDEEPT